MPPDAAHLLFSANRWEFNKDIKDALECGITVLTDRYVASGVAYSRAIGLDPDWCEHSDKGLLRPDVTIQLEISNQTQLDRGGFGIERYENIDLQRKVHEAFRSISDQTWVHINGEFDEKDVGLDVLCHATAAINLYSSEPISVF